MPPRNISQAPLAVCSDGQLVAGLGYVEDIETVGQVVRLLREARIVGPIFVGVVLDGAQAAAARKRIDDAAAEIAATCNVIRPRRGHR